MHLYIGLMSKSEKPLMEMRRVDCGTWIGHADVVICLRSIFFKSLLNGTNLVVDFSKHFEYKANKSNWNSNSNSVFLGLLDKNCFKNIIVTELNDDNWHRLT